MSVKGAPVILILVALLVRTSMPFQCACFPSGFQNFEPLMSYLDAEDIGLLSFYLLYSPPRPKMLTRCERLLSTRALILILLATGCTEINPGKFYQYYFYYYYCTVLNKIYKNICHLCNLSLIDLKS